MSDSVSGGRSSERLGTGIDLGQLRTEEFPQTSEHPYLNHASYGPIPQCYVRAATLALGEMSNASLGDVTAYAFDKAQSVRRAAAEVMKCSPEDIALMHSTSEGLGLVAQGLDWHLGDEVVLYALEHPNAVYPWKNLADRGVVTRFVPDRGFRFDMEDVEASVTSRTRVVCVSMVNFGHGFRAPIADLGRLCKERGIWLVVDGVQAVGAIGVTPSAHGVDILAAHGYKWLMGGLGIGLCYCSPRVRDELRVPQPGWFGRKDPRDVRVLSAFEVEFCRDARRFEASEPSLPELFGLNASLDLLLRFGVSSIEARIKELTDRAVAQLDERGYRVVSARDQQSWSGIISATPPATVSTEAIETQLHAASITCSIRQGLLRVSPHFYNSGEEIDKLTEALPR